MDLSHVMFPSCYFISRWRCLNSSSLQTLLLLHFFLYQKQNQTSGIETKTQKQLFSLLCGSHGSCMRMKSAVTRQLFFLIKPFNIYLMPLLERSYLLIKASFTHETHKRSKFMSWGLKTRVINATLLMFF